MDYDVAIIGGGPGGYAAALRAAQLGAAVCLIEQGDLGGTCLNRGCIPTKTLLASSSLLDKINRAADFGVKVGSVTVDLSLVMQRKEAIVGQLLQGINCLLDKKKVAIFRGRGRLRSPNRIIVDSADGSEEVYAHKTIIATGTEVAMLSSLGYNGREIITSNEALKLTEVPETLLVIGGGVVGCELATFFAALGTRVTIVEMMPNILPSLDQELARRQQSLLRKRGMEICTRTKIAALEVVAGRAKATLQDGREITAARALVSVGRLFNTRHMGLEEVGVALGPRGEVLVDNYLETSVKGIYAIGDITNKMQLAHLASAQGKVAAGNALGDHREIDYRLIPICVFTDPEIASVGLTSEEARRLNAEIKVGKVPFSISGKALSMGETGGMVKVLVEAATGRLLGVHIHGSHASDLIGEATVALKADWTAEDLAGTIHAHPTLAEALVEAAEAVRRRER